jgi:hypothetical protein
VSVSATTEQIALLKLTLTDVTNAGVAQVIEFSSHDAEYIATIARLAPITDTN